MDIWKVLGISSTRDRKTIKRAYARRLKQIRPEHDNDIEAFQNLRRAYEFALKLVGKSQKRIESEQAENALLKIKSISPFDLTGRNRLFNYKKIKEQTMGDEINMHPNPSAHKFVDKIIKGLERSESVAIHYFKRSMELPDLLNLELRDQYEELLVRRLIKLSPFPYQLLSVVSETFDWHQRTKQLDGPLAFCIHNAVNRLRAHSHLEQLRSSSINRKSLYRHQRVAIEALLGECDERKFRWLVRSRLIKNSIKHYMDEFNLNYPELIHYELDPHTVAWWRSAIENIHIQWHQGIMALIFSFFSTRVLVNSGYDHSWFLAFLPTFFIVFVLVDLAALQWQLNWRLPITKSLNKYWYDAFGIKGDSIYRFLWCTLLGACIIAGKWLALPWALFPLLIFYLLMSMVVSWQVLFIISTACYYLQYWIGLWVEALLSDPTRLSGFAYYIYAGIVSLMDFLGTYPLYLSLVLIFSGGYIMVKRRII